MSDSVDSDVLRTELRSSLRDVATAWDALVDQSPLPSPFLRSWWLEALAGPHPAFVLAFRDDRLLGGMAFEQDRVLGVVRLRPVGYQLSADHLDLVADPAHVDDVMSALRVWFGRPGARIIDLVGLTEDARIIDALPPPVRQREFDVAPWSPLPATLDEYFALHPQVPGLVDRPQRRLERAGVEYRIADVCETRAALERLRRLHETNWGERSEFLPRFDRFARAATEGAARGEVIVHELWAQEDVVAADVSFEVAGRLSSFQCGRDTDRRWRGAGNWLMAQIVADACKRGCHEFDLLRGGEPYKEQWASDSRPLVHAIASRGWRARLVVALLPAARRAQSTMKRLAPWRAQPSVTAAS
jgi:CelD/BcsL family acetyltransferase involved in cellulose biosynthesis